MSLENIASHASGKFEVAAVGPRTIELRGVLDARDPVAELGPHIRKIHEAAAGGAELVVDVTKLEFVNSSGLRIFLRGDERRVLP